MTNLSVNPMLLWIPLLPLIGSAINGIFGSKLPKKLVPVIACGSVLLSAALAFMVASVVVRDNTRVAFDLGTWMASGDFSISGRLAVDQLSAIMICVITGVGFLIHLYSAEYMAEDPSVHRYFSYLNLFIFAMSILVLGDNLVMMFVGWEGVGLCSYLLIGFWFDDNEKATAGKKAFVVNRIGDFGVILGTMTLLLALGTVEFPAMKQAFLALGPDMQVMVATVAGLFLFLGATGKSAQLPLYVWLPDAMAGPTPVSALIHAATMVTAGIYMICRLNFVFAASPIALAVIATVGAATALFAATMGLFQTDIKKILAYSTVSQLGYMFLGVGVGAFGAGFFHVFTHAFFKACLFLGSGAVIHALHHEQDVRRMGGLARKLPITCATFVISTLAIMGFPGFSGFFSKDEILWQAFASGFGPYAATFAGLNYVLFAVGLITAGLTSFYMWRVTLLTFFSGSYRGPKEVFDHAHEAPFMSFALIVLAAFALLVGFLNVPELFHGHSMLTTFLSPVLGPPPALQGEHHSLEWGLMGLTLVVAFGAFGLAWKLFGRGLSTDTQRSLEALPEGSTLVKAIANKWYVDEIYEAAVVKPLVKVSDIALFKVFDAFLIDKVLLGLFAWPIRYGGHLIRWLQNGSLQRYATVFVSGVVVVLWMVLK